MTSLGATKDNNWCLQYKPVKWIGNNLTTEWSKKMKFVTHFFVTHFWLRNSMAVITSQYDVIRGNRVTMGAKFITWEQNGVKSWNLSLRQIFGWQFQWQCSFSKKFFTPNMTSFHKRQQYETFPTEKIPAHVYILIFVFSARNKTKLTRFQLLLFSHKK